MHLTSGAKIIFVGLAVGTALTLAGVGYAGASSSTTSVTACVSSKHRLGVPSKKGKCAKGYKKITLNRQGPRGATGARGTTGPAGPGARRLYLNTSADGRTPTVQVGRFGYYLSCEVTTIGTNVTAVASVHVIASGQSASLSTVYNYTSGAATTPTTNTYRTSFTGDTSFHGSVANGVQHTYVDAMHVVGADGTVQQVSVDITADGQATPTKNRCLITGTVVPSS